MRYSTGHLIGYAALTFSFYPNVSAEGGAACKDLQGRSFESGLHYIPGTEPCTFCVCDNGNPKLCKAIICKFPEANCKSFRRGDTCCEFICLDDTLSSMSNEKGDGSEGNMADGTTNYDIGLRSVASFVTAILSLSLLFFLIHRLRQRKIRVCVAGRQSRQLAEDQRSLGNMGYLERGGLQHGVPMDDMPCGGGYPLWKPPESYFPRGEAPPPYEEAVAAARAEQALLSINPHTLPPLNFQNNYLSNTNNNTSIAVVGSNQTGLSPNSTTVSSNNGANTSPLVTSTGSRPLGSPNTHTNCHQSNQTSSVGLHAGTSMTSFTIDANTYENLPAPRTSNFPQQYSVINCDAQSFPSFPSTTSNNYQQQHTTLPRQSGAFTISATMSSSNVSTHRTIPRTLTTRAGMKLKEVASDCPANEFFHLSPKSKSRESLPCSASPAISNNQTDPMKSDLFYKDILSESASSSSRAPQAEIPQMSSGISAGKSCELDLRPTPRPLNLSNEINEDGSFESVTCTCSIQALPTLHDDADDYRSECENCKSATGSRYYLDNEDELVTSPHETMTLHRRPEETTSTTTPQYYRTSLTLPTSTRQRTRSTGVRENWFSTMPQSSTESSDEN